MSVGEMFVQKLTRALWYIDPHHSKFAGRSIQLPPQLGSFEGYNNYRHKKEKEPQLSVSGISHHVQELSSALMQPWFHHRRFELLKKEVEMLVEGLQKYCEYLKGRNEFMIEHHHSMTQSQLVDDNTSLTTVPICSGLVHSDCADLEENLRSLDFYKPVFLNDFSPADRFKRRTWIANLALPYPTCIYRYAYGNNLGTLSYIWKIPYGPVDQTAVSRVFANLNKEQITYSTRAMRHDFLQRYNRLVKTPKSVLRNIYRTLLNDGSQPSCSVEAEVDERVAKAVVNLDDPEIVLDLRSTNGKPNSTRFDQFWAELQAYMDEINLAVDDRRHGDTLHLPFAISVRHLQEVIGDRLREKHPGDCPPIPSLEWIRLQFWPSNQYTIRALRYTGRFQVKFVVQVRQLHRDHQDSHYVSALLQYLRAFAVQFHSYCRYVSVDDKATIPIGDPSCPLSTGVRGHNRSLVSLSGPQLHALDHDFHVCGIIPSVAFVVDIPENSADSFFSGQPFVICKDKITQPSSALRHSTELTNIIRTHYGTPDNYSSKPILIIVSDGGPDHRVTFGSVKIANLCLFRALNLDMLVCVRTCPYQSWQNLAERVMSTLNLALQNVSLARSKMTDEFERLISSLNTLTDVRKAIDKRPELGEALSDSLSPIMVLLGQRFGAMKLKGRSVKLGVPATEAEMSEQFMHSQFIEPGLQRERLTQDVLKSASGLQKFLKHHCHSSHYVYQLKKCTDQDCYYCKEHPIRLPPEVFSKLSFLPLPLFDASKEHYEKFEKLYGQFPDERGRPSYVPVASEEAKEKDKSHRGIIVKAKVRGAIICEDCKKTRCFYSSSKLSQREALEVERIKELKLYICGSPLFPDDSPLASNVVVREAITCASPIELQYYNSVLVHFPPICYFCGLGEENLVNDDHIKELKKSYAIVLPICFICQSDGKSPFCKQPSNVAKRRKIN